jgi:rhodanese-related sulfurtransferase
VNDQHKKMRRYLSALPLLLASSVSPAHDYLLETMQDYLQFAAYSEGSLSPKQLQEVGLESFYLVDSRRPADYQADHLPGAVNIEWREILERKSELPEDRPVLLYCETGLLSSRAHFALRLSGFENVKVLLGGLNQWRSETPQLDSAEGN